MSPTDGQRRPLSLPVPWPLVLFLLPPTVLIIVAIYGGLGRASHPYTAEACLPSVGKSVRTPGFWSLFDPRRTQDGSAREEYDEATTERSEWTTVSSGSGVGGGNGLEYAVFGFGLPVNLMSLQTDWIEKHKYELEQHNVITADGYRLVLHRLPQPGHRPVLLVHGLMTSSLGWVFMGPDRSLAFLLRDKKHDVWLANLRGSMYGRENSHKNASSEEFWQYSFHEQGVHDLAAIIEQIRNETSFHQVSLITHSQAFNAFLALCSLKPKYNERILFLQALAPTLQLRNITRIKPKDMKKIQKYLRAKSKAKEFELFPKDSLRETCLDSTAEERKLCKTTMRMLAGREQYPKSIEPLVYGQLLQGGSVREALHLTQMWISGDFAAFDYGIEGNMQHYNSVSPLVYDLSQITVPMILHFGETDAIATPDGVHSIYSQTLKTIMGVYRVAAATFNHLDFLCATDIKTLVNEKVIDLMEKYFAGQLLYVIE